MAISSHHEQASRVRAGRAGPVPAEAGLVRKPTRARALIADRWYGPHHSWWKVDTEDGLYVLRRDDSSGEWALAAITRD